MFRQRDRSLRIAYIVSDFIMTSLAFFIFNILRFNILYPSASSELIHYLTSHKLLVEQVIVPLLLMLVYAISGYYNTPFPRSRLSEFMSTAACAVVNSFLIFTILLINDPTPRRRTEYYMIFILFLLLLGFTYIGRIIITLTAVKRARKSSLEYKTVIIGNSFRAQKAAEMILSSKTLNKNCISAFVSIHGENESRDGYDDVPTIELSELKDFCKKEKVSQIVLAPEKSGDKTILRMLVDYIELDIPIKIAPDDLDYAVAGIHTDDIMGNTLINLASPRIGEFSQNLKRVFDVSISILMLGVLFPFLIVIAIMIKLDSTGPLFYTQERIGRHHRPFKIIKFRSMNTDAEASGPQLSSDSDPRITKIGKFMRRYRIDELPQLWNVIRGDMSIVGPRPEREFYIRQIVKEVPYYGLIYQVRPGITSWAMVKFGYASTIEQMVERTKFDMIYINNMSLLLDFKILIHTIKTVIGGEGK